MAVIIRSALSFSLVLCLVFGAILPSRGFAQVHESASSGALLVTQETQLISEIDRQADLVFQEFKKAYPQAPMGFLKKTQRQIVLRLKQMGVLTDILKASGSAPSMALVAGEVLPNFVFFPIATAMGKPLIASAMVTVPWGLISSFGVFSYQMMKVRRELAKELNVSSLAEYDRIRTAVIGYDIKKRVFSSIYKTLDGDVFEFEVFKKSLKLEAMKAPSISIPELEVLVKSHREGGYYLESNFMEKLDSVAYAALLLRFVNDDADLTSQMVSILSSRAAMALPDAAAALRNYSMIVADLQTQIKREIKKINLLKSTVMKKRMKSFDIWGEETKDVSEHLSVELERLQNVRRQLSRAEYSLLIEAESFVKEANARAIEALVSERQSELKVLTNAGRFVEYSPARVRGGSCRDLFARAF